MSSRQQSKRARFAAKQKRISRRSRRLMRGGNGRLMKVRFGGGWLRNVKPFDVTIDFDGQHLGHVVVMDEIASHVTPVYMDTTGIADEISSHIITGFK